MNNLSKRIKRKIKKTFSRENNMHLHPAEQYYFNQYFETIRQYLPSKGAEILDIACENGRFTIPLAKAGFNITATEINSKYFDYIKKNLPAGAKVEFRKETVQDTLLRKEKLYDAILCLELLYYMKDYKTLLNGFSGILKPEGVLITSHRALGYYVYRYIKEKKFTELNALLNSPDPDYNCQTPQQLNELYASSGFRIETIKPIGMFSGLLDDAFAGIADPGKMNEKEQQKLASFENNTKLQELFLSSSRYILVIAKHQ